VIGLVAGKMVEEFYKPTIVVSIGEKFSKASARSISGFNMIEFIRGHSSMLVDVGGHPMAAGFTVETAKLKLLQKTLESKAESLIDKDLLTRSLKIDCELSLSMVDIRLFKTIQKLEPFGMGNPQPVFMCKNVKIYDMRTVGTEGSHLKLRLSQGGVILDGIGFGLGERVGEFKIGDEVDIAYTMEKDEWNGEERIQLKIKDLRF
jgi:single-stranded-DNA-specific exonuclease